MGTATVALIITIIIAMLLAICYYGMPLATVSGVADAIARQTTTTITIPAAHPATVLTIIILPIARLLAPLIRVIEAVGDVPHPLLVQAPAPQVRENVAVGDVRNV